MKQLRLIGLSLFVVALVACGGPTSADGGVTGTAGGTGASGGSAAGGTAGGGTGASGGSTGGGTVDAGPFDAGLKTPDGGVPLLASAVFTQSSARSSVVVTFTNLPVDLPTTTTRCHTSSVQGCRVTDCARMTAVDAGMVPTPRSFNAGPISLSGLVDGGVTLTLMDGLYQLNVAGELWTPGSTLTLTASGDEVSAFSVPLVTAGPVSLVAPSCSGMRCPDLTRSSEALISWAGRQGSVSVSVTRGLLTVDCSAPADQGSLRVPREALELLSAGEAALTVSCTTLEPVLVHDWLINRYSIGSLSSWNLTLR